MYGHSFHTKCPQYFLLIDPLSEPLSVDDSPIESKIDSYSATLCSLSTKPPDSNCEIVIIYQACSLEYVAYEIHKTMVMLRVPLNMEVACMLTN